jgi:DNA-binding MarR family transcriptional regulator
LAYLVSMETRSPALLYRHIGFWMRLVSNHVSGTFAAKLAGEGVSVIEWVALRALYEGGLSASLLAKRIGLTKGGLTKLADRLIRHGLVERRADSADGRAQTLMLTRKALALIPRLAALADRNDAEFFGFLPKTERARLEKTLKILASHHGLKGVPTS